MGNNTVLIIVGVLCVGCVCLAGGLLLLWMNRDTKEEDPYKDLPTSPPKLPASVLQPLPPNLRKFMRLLYDTTAQALFGSKSDCWAANHWIRVTSANQLVDIMKSLVKVQAEGIKKKWSSTQFQAAQNTLWVNIATRMVLGMQELEACPKSTVITVPVLDLASMFRGGTTTSQKYEQKTVAEILATLEDIKSGKRTMQAF